MAVRNAYATATNCTGLLSITLRDSFSQAAASCEIVCTATTLAIGDSVTIDLGFADEHQAVMTGGVVKSIRVNRPEYTYTVTVMDVLTKAVDYYMASDDPDSPFTASNIKAEDLVVQLLAQAGITGVTADSTIFTFATAQPVKINLISVWDAVQDIAKICGYVVYANAAGAVFFSSRKPYIVGGDVAAFTFATGATGTLLDGDYTKSDEKIRNRVVVYGAPGVKYTAQASSPYLPAGFYKTMVVSHELIDMQSMAVSTGDLNLTMFNRLTETYRARAVGKPGIRARSIVAVNETYTLPGDTNPWFVFATNHSWSRSGYSMDLTLIR